MRMVGGMGKEDKEGRGGGGGGGGGGGEGRGRVGGGTPHDITYRHNTHTLLLLGYHKASPARISQV